MKSNRLLKYLATIFILCLLSACSSEENTNIPTDTSISFQLSKLNSTSLGTVYTTELVGSDPNGINITGIHSIVNREKIMLNGVLITPHDINLRYQSMEGITAVGDLTNNIDSDGNLISETTQDSDWNCTPVSPDRMPNSVKIGESGVLSTLLCLDDIKIERSWKIEDGFNGKANVVTQRIHKNNANEIITSIDQIYSIFDNGDIFSFKYVSKVTQTEGTFELKSI